MDATDPRTNAPALAGPKTAGGRITGLDVARAFAVIGMVLVNFKITMGAEQGDPGWLRAVAAAFDGRAAATFVVLAGVGASLGSRRARVSGDPELRRHARAVLAKRALFLFVIGWAFFLIWPADILHYYGVYLAIGALVLFASNRRLAASAAGAVLISLTFLVGFDFFANWDLAEYSYQGLGTPAGFLRNLFLDGFHPVFPWIAFYLFGMWLGRTDLRDRAWRATLTLRAAVVVVVTETAAWIVLGPKGGSLERVEDTSWRWLFSVEPIPPLPMYLAAGAGTAVLVIVGSIWLTEHLPGRVTEPLVATGQLALSIYVAHVLVGMVILDTFGRLENQSLTWAVTTSLVFSVAAIGFSWAWRRRFARGPLEALMRRVAG
ncbi:MAG: heparan-alpha-glucosaminide N-acetyltransferase domain-containing protein [Candidatus Nanopelagicales bacterium]